ncbi:MAG TPA: hypothetical protein VF719_06675 [Abditibacteriaceae bacterium]
MTINNERGFWFSAYLVFLIVLHSLVSIMNMSKAWNGEPSRAGEPQWTAWLFALISLVFVICSLSIWRFKRWGVVGFVLISLVYLGVKQSLGREVTITGLLPACFIVWMASGKWKDMT